MKKVISILMALCILLTTFAGCSENIRSDSTTTTAEPTTVEVAIDLEGTIIDSDGNLLSKEDYTIDDSGNVVKNDGTVIGNIEDIKEVEEHTTRPSTTTEQSSSNPNIPTSNMPNNTTTTTLPSTTLEPKPLVLPNGGFTVESKPSLSESYIIPDESVTYKEYSSTNIYENKYVKLDVTKAKSGYLTITYKEKWADKLHVALEEFNAFTEEYVDTHHYYYSYDEFKENVITLNLPKKEANYYITIWSTINGTQSCKLEVDLGRITTNDVISIDDILPNTDAIKLTQTATGIYSNKYVKINTNTASKGYIEVQYIEPNGYNIEVNVNTKVANQRGTTGAWHYYTTFKAPCTLKVALTYGNTEYTINVWSTMNGEYGNMPSKKAELTIKLSNVSQTGGFLLSTGEVIYNQDMNFIKKANEIAATCSNGFEVVSKIYDWLTSYMSYKIYEETSVRHYKCNLQTVYNRKAGVCYDYAVVLAAMLRSQGIPCKVVFGKYSNSTSGNGHAWNEVYITQSGSISTNKLAIDGKKWCRLDPTLTSVNPYPESITFMNNSSNYLWDDYY